MEMCDVWVCLFLPLGVWMGINIVLVFIGAYMVTYHAPHAAGSGIPQIKCYLNGIRLPGLLSLTTLVAKAGGVILSVCGGLACGKEGPMIHSGAICASGLVNGQFRCFGKKCAPKMCAPVRSDEERRDFVAAGAAAGVSAAFGAPVGGVLFSLEEGASFIKQGLTWHMLFSSATASLMLNIMMSALKGHPEDMSNPGLVSFGYVSDVSFKTWEIPIFMVMAVFGGLSGALFVQLNYHNTIWRRKNVQKKWAKVVEACVVAAASALVITALIYGVPDCQPIEGYHPPSAVNTTDPVPVPYDHNDTILAVANDHVDLIHKRSSGNDHGDDHATDAHAADTHADDSHGGSHDKPYGDHGGSHGYVVQGFCDFGEHNRMADILFKTPEGGLHAMLHGDLNYWSMGPLLVLFVVYHLLATWTYGLSVSSGVFIPSLLIGAIWGRIFGMIVMTFLPSAGTNIAKYCLIGAACQLGGTVRMTISLTVIVIECTGDITFGIPIMISLIIAKWMGDFFNPGIYDLHIEIMGIPLLPWESPEMTETITAGEVMNAPVISLRTIEKIGRIGMILGDKDTLHNGFPVVEDYDPDGFDGVHSGTFGRLKGFILRSQLREVLESDGMYISDEDKDQNIDLRLHMDKAPYAIQENISLPKIFKLFRGLGLRHLVVVNDRNRVTGMITRIDLARFRGEIHKGKFHLEELEVLDD